MLVVRGQRTGGRAGLMRLTDSDAIELFGHPHACREKKSISMRSECKCCPLGTVALPLGSGFIFSY